MDHPTSGLTMVDILAIGTIVISAALALLRGIVRELLSLGAWIGAGFAAVYLYPYVKPWMHEHIKSPATANIATGIAVFCIALAILIPLGMYLASLVQGRALTAIDRSLGFVYGLARGALIVCLLYLITLWVWPDQDKEPDLLAQAKTRPLLVIGANVLRSYIPHGDLDKATDDLLKQADDRHVLDDQRPIDKPPTIGSSPTAVPGAVPADKPTSYDNQSRVGLDHLIQQPAPQPQQVRP